MEERVDIEITDKISPNIERKLVKIATAAEEANKALLKVSRNLSKIQTKEINALSSAQAKLDATSTKTAVALQKIATESSRTAIAQAKMIAATQRASTASVQLATAQARLNATQSQAAAAADRAAMAHLRLESAQSRTQRGSSLLGEAVRSVYVKLLALYGAVQSVGGILKLVDAYTFMENRLRAVGVSGEAVGTTMKRIEGVANSTRNSLQSTVELYSRLSLSTKQFGYSQEDLLKVTTAMNQAIRIGGSTTQEASNALIQLSQGMSSGRLQGDELRSVLEQLPIVADVIAKHLGITRGELRAFGREGKLTTQAIMEAFSNAAPELEARFKTLTMTVDEALTYLKNKFQVAMKGELGEVIASLAKAIGWVADNLDDLLPIVKTLLTIGAVGYIANFATKMLTLAGNISKAAQALKSFQLFLPTSSTLATLGESGAGAFATITKALNTTIGTLPSLLVLLGGALYLYQRINQEAAKRQGEEEKQAATERMMALNTQINTLKAERLQKLGIVEATGYTGTRATTEKALARTRVAAIDSQLLTLQKNYDASLAVLGDTVERVDGASELSKQLQGAFSKYNAVAKPENVTSKEEEEKLSFRVETSDFASLRAQYDQIYAAKMKYGQAVVTVSEAMRTGNMTIEVANKLLTRAEEEYTALLEPMNAVNKALDIQQLQLGMTGDQLEVNNKLRELELQYIERGLTLTPAVAAAYTLRLKYLQEATKYLRERTELTEKIRGPEKSPSVAKVMSQAEDGFNTREQVQGYFVRENPQLFEGSKEAMNANVAAYREMYAKIAALHKGDYMVAETASKAKVNLWFKEHEILINGTADTFGNLAQLSESSNKKLNMIGYAAANLQLAMNSVRAITLAWASAPFPANIPAVATTTTAMGIQEAKLNGLAGFAFGGDFTVGGTGGIDSQTVAFRATPGEQVSITTPEQRARQGESSGTTNIYHYHDHVEGGTKAERESRFAQFQRDTRTVQSNRTSDRAQVSV